MMKLLRYWLRNYFGFSQTEANGFVVILAFMLSLLAFPALLSYFLSLPKTLTTDTKRFDSLLIVLNQYNLPDSAVRIGNIPYQPFDDNLGGEVFAFDPNTIGLAEWKRLGLREKIAQNILKYKSKGGIFRQKSDLRKVYGFPKALYDRLEPYIQLPENTSKRNNKSKKQNFEEEYITTNTPQNTKASQNKPKTTARFDLNTADTATLKQVKGIGRATAKQIVNYRERLGGFIHTAQLSEVLLLQDKPEVVAELLKFGYLESPQVRKINLNTVTENELRQHPYFRNLAKVIINYRTQHGAFQDMTELKKIKLITEEVLQKVLPYLSL
jgi:DNA uptake protein ComE-like DNA-binding protein